MKVIYVALTALVITVGCGSSDDASEPAVQQADVDSDAVDAENYDIAYTVCGYVLDGTADKGDITADPESNPAAFADEYAEDYGDARRQAVYDGCLDALEGREKSPPG